MKFLFSLISLFLTMTVGASNDPFSWNHSIVKVRSYPCLSKRPVFEGSGILVSYRNDTFVVTSEHVLIHDEGPRFCHEVTSEKLGVVKSKLIAVSFTKGLGLLQVPSLKHSLAINSEELNTSIELNQSYSALGFPAGGKKLQTLKNGKLITSQSERYFIPLVRDMLELSGLPVEYGMSGGVLIDGNNLFAGILSHQVLRRNPGEMSRVGVVDSLQPTRFGDLTLAIPAAEVYQWLDSTLSGHGERWQRYVEGQLKGQSILRYGPLLFELKNVSEGELFEIGGDGAGIGGDGAGIGGDGAGIGGDGAGIGGGEYHKKKSFIEIRLDPLASLDDKSAQLANPILDKWRNWLLRGERLRIVFTKDARKVRLNEFHSLEEFLTLWLRNNQRPLVLRTSDSDNFSVRTMMILSQEIIKFSQEARDTVEDIDLKSWLGLVREYGVLGQNGLMTAMEIEDLLGSEHSQMWNFYYELDFDQAVKLESLLVALKNNLEKIGLR